MKAVPAARAEVPRVPRIRPPPPEPRRSKEDGRPESQRRKLVGAQVNSLSLGLGGPDDDVLEYSDDDDGGGSQGASEGMDSFRHHSSEGTAHDRDCGAGRRREDGADDGEASGRSSAAGTGAADRGNNTPGAGANGMSFSPWPFYGSGGEGVPAAYSGANDAHGRPSTVQGRPSTVQTYSRIRPSTVQGLGGRWVQGLGDKRAQLSVFFGHSV